MAEVLGGIGQNNYDMAGNYSTWAAIAAEEAERELEERDIEAMLADEGSDAISWDADNET